MKRMDDGKKKPIDHHSKQNGKRRLKDDHPVTEPDPEFVDQYIKDVDRQQPSETLQIA
jgi:hypothetical protein